MSLFQFYLYIAGSTHVSGPQAVNYPEDGPVGPKHVEIRQYINKIEIVTSVGFYSIHLLVPIFETTRCFQMTKT